MVQEPRLAVLIMAAGSGLRAGGGVPKQYRPVAGVPLITRTIGAMRAALPRAAIHCVISADAGEAFAAATAGLSLAPPLTGGRTRQESVRRGLEALAADPPDIVLIQDGARPFAPPALVAQLVAALADGTDGVAPGVAVSDTLKSCGADGHIEGTVPRDGLWRVQTPQVFRYAPILAAHCAVPPELELTDDLAVAERAGLKLRLVAGDDANFKITTEADFERAERVLATMSADIRSAQGFDVHAFGPGDHVMLCGVRIPYGQGLEGHSDADVGLHAITDALLGCIAAGDIGAHFPPSDARWKGANSAQFLAHAASLIAERAGLIAHVDVTLICEAPKVGPHRDAMRTRIAEILKIDLGRVSVKATTTERLGFTGRREGIAAMASATVRLPL